MRATGLAAAYGSPRKRGSRGRQQQSQCRSPDEAKRNPGRPAALATLLPHSAALHAGYRVAYWPYGLLLQCPRTSPHMRRVSISQNWRNTRRMKPRSSSSSRTGNPIDWVRWKRANENDDWLTSVFTDAVSSGISSATWIGLSFGNAPQ